jgi:replicative DNA helicase
MDALDRISAASSQNSAITGLATGFRDLDFKTSGFQPSDLILVAARPSMGKTAFVLNIAAYMAFREHRRVAIFSLEMSKEQLVNRLLAQESNVDASRLRNGRLKDSEWENLVMGADVIGKSELVIDDTPGISVPELRSKCRRMKLEGGLDCIMVDYLQLMSGSGRGSDSRQQEISEISRGLKEVAREMHVPLIALSQLSRAVEQRPDHRPVLSDLRESGAIEQDADVVIFLYRDDYYNKDSERQGIADILIRKQRNGPLGDVELVWLPEYTKFANPMNERDRAQKPGV